mmetsp:Transcript_81965/g.228456  ORF Transcript_81965/g.228456 Transcript_81965/m.228456 type:complete len:416 (-) Transcript_81965:621-1868(-)
MCTFHVHRRRCWKPPCTQPTYAERRAWHAPPAQGNASAAHHEEAQHFPAPPPSRCSPTTAHELVRQGGDRCLGAPGEGLLAVRGGVQDERPIAAPVVRPHEVYVSGPPWLGGCLPGGSAIGAAVHETVLAEHLRDGCDLLGTENEDALCGSGLLDCRICLARRRFLRRDGDVLDRNICLAARRRFLRRANGVFDRRIRLVARRRFLRFTGDVLGRGGQGPLELRRTPPELLDALRLHGGVLLTQPLDRGPLLRCATWGLQLRGRLVAGGDITALSRCLQQDSLATECAGQFLEVRDPSCDGFCARQSSAGALLFHLFFQSLYLPALLVLPPFRFYARRLFLQHRLYAQIPGLRCSQPRLRGPGCLAGAGIGVVSLAQARRRGSDASAHVVLRLRRRLEHLVHALVNAISHESKLV